MPLSRAWFGCMVNELPLVFAIVPLMLPCLRTTSAADGGFEPARRRISIVWPGMRSEADAKLHCAQGVPVVLLGTCTEKIVEESTTASPRAGLLSTVTEMLAIEAPAELFTVTVMVWVPGESVRASRIVANGIEVIADPICTPSTANVTLLTVAVPFTVAATVTMPETVALFTGSVIVTVGAAPATVTTRDLLLKAPPLSLTTTVTVKVPAVVYL